MGELSGSSKRWNSISVAASDATAAEKLGADFVCDGTADEVQIAAAHTALPSTGGSISLSSGTFEIASRLTFSKVTELKGQGNSTILNFGTGDIGPYISASGSSVRNLRCTGSSSSGFIIGISATVAAPVRDVKIINNTFEGIDQVVWLFNADGVLVQGNTFNGTGYGVIQQFANTTEGHNVVIDGNYFRNMSSDCITVNGSGTNTNKMRGWTVSNNVFDGNTNYPTSSLENRFLALSYTYGTIISGNQIRHASGDSAIHIEGSSGELVIADNVLTDCIGDAYITIITSSAHSVISGNLFYLSATGSGSTIGIRSQDAVYSSRLTIVGNRFAQGDSGLDLLAISLRDSSYHLISGNYFEKCSRGVRAYSGVTGMNISNNHFLSCDWGIDADPRAASGGSNNNWLISGNYFVDTQTACIDVARNDSGSSPSSDWLVTGNFFDANVQGYDTSHMTLMGNYVASGVSTFSLGLNGGVGSANYIVRQNKNFKTENGGSGTISSGSTSAVVTHGLDVTPVLAEIFITLGENPTNTPGAIWVDTITSTQFTVNCENDPGASNLDFGWLVITL